MENTEYEFPCIPDDGTHPIAWCEGIEYFYNTHNNDNNCSNEYYNSKNVINDVSTNYSNTSTEEFEMRTIVDNNPIAEWRPPLFPILSEHEEMIKIKNEKIFPFVIEDLTRVYNYYRFPERIRREPRVLKKYNDLANYALVTIYLLFHADTQMRKKPRLPYQAKAEPRPRLTHFAKIAHEIIDAPMKSLKAKLSQIELLDVAGKNPKISYGLVKAFNEIQHMDPRILWDIIKNHATLDALQEIKNLIAKDKQC